MTMGICWCGKKKFIPFNTEYGKCRTCGTLVSLKGLAPEKLQVLDDETDFYGKKYWLDHQSQDLDFPDIYKRSRNDLTERNLHWLQTLLKYCMPPAKVLELGCSHGSFVALMGQAGFDASGVEMSPWVVDFGQKTFGVPISVGPIENLDIDYGSLDVIVLMDVLEHLPDPHATMGHCLKLLKPDGLLLIQTPQFKESMNYKALVKSKGAFLDQLKADEHLYLFSDQSVTQLFNQLGAQYIEFEPAIFGHYDMFFAVSREPFQVSTPAQIESALLSTSNGRFALALVDIYNRELVVLAQLKADKAHLIAKLEASEADRAARLEVIQSQGQQLGRIPQLEAEKERLIAQLESSEAEGVARTKVIESQNQQLEAEKEQLIVRLQTSEADRAARLEVIQSQGQQLGRIPQLEAEKEQLIARLESSEADRVALYANKWVQMGIKTKLIATKKP